MARALRLFGSAGLTALLAFSISACQKKEQTDVSMMDSTQISQGYGTDAPADQTSPEAQPGAQGAELPKATQPSTKASSSKGSTKASSTPSTYAEKRTFEIPAGTAFEVEMITPADTRTSNVGDRVEAKLAAPITHE